MIQVSSLAAGTRYMHEALPTASVGALVSFIDTDPTPPRFSTCCDAPNANFVINNNDNAATGGQDDNPGFYPGGLILTMYDEMASLANPLLVKHWQREQKTAYETVRCTIIFSALLWLWSQREANTMF